MNEMKCVRNKVDENARTVRMLGLDFGSTTSSAIVAEAGIGMNCATGRMSFSSPRILYRSEPVFTPFTKTGIDQEQLNGYLKFWLRKSNIDLKSIFAGGAIITGLAAKRKNAETIAGMINKRIGNALIATADDPCLESWLAFMGSCMHMSRYHRERTFINLDIGGGTTNPAKGTGGNVFGTGCYFIGARHFRFEPGTYRLMSVSSYGRKLMHCLGIRRAVGQELSESDLDSILNFYITALEDIASGSGNCRSDLFRYHEQSEFKVQRDENQNVITFSGGVGELVYRIGTGRSLPGTTHYGDLGIDIARRISLSPVLSRDIHRFVPDHMGRATVYGLAIHSTEISGSTIFLPKPESLPISDLPVIMQLDYDSHQSVVDDAVAMVGKSRKGACILINTRSGSTSEKNVCCRQEIVRLGKRFADALSRQSPDPGHPVVLLTPDNIGKTLGNYATDWNQLPVNLVVIDEIPERNAHFVNIGTPHHQMVPVSFYGMR